jgi:hypothetical protein
MSKSQVTRHTSHVTRHTSHVTRHTSHVTRHTSHAQHLMRLYSIFAADPAVAPVNHLHHDVALLLNTCAQIALNSNMSMSCRMENHVDHQGCCEGAGTGYRSWWRRPAHGNQLVYVGNLTNNTFDCSIEKNTALNNCFFTSPSRGPDKERIITKSWL